MSRAELLFERASRAGSNRSGKERAGRAPVIRVPALLLVLCAAIVALAGTPGRAQTPGGDPPTREAQLEVIRREITALESQLEGAAGRAADLRTQLRDTELELQLQEARLAEAVAAHALAEQNFAIVQSEFGDLTQRIEALRAVLGQRLSTFYRLGGQGYVRLLLAARGEGRALPALRVLRYLLERDARTFRQYRLTSVELEAKREDLLLRQREIEIWVNAESEHRVALEMTRERQAAVYERAEQQRVNLVRRTESLSEKEARLLRLLDALRAEGEAELAGTPIQDFAGALDWPLWGRVITPFGPRRDARYGTMVPNNGIEIGSAPGESVRVVYPGRVLYADDFQGYGFTVVVQHKTSVLTLYAGLSELKVKRGDVLDLGDIVGLSATRLYFEVRRDNRPRNPDDWLR